MPPAAYRPDVPRLKVEIVGRVEAGETVRAVCRGEGMPSRRTLRHWALADPAFGEALAAALRRGAWRRLWTYDEAKAEAFLARARAGEPMRSLLGRPGMPTLRQYRRWRASQPPFAEAVFTLVERSEAGRRDRCRARRRDFDQAVADQIVGRLNRGLADGLSLGALTSSAHPDLPCWRTVARWRREQPDFDAALRWVMSGRRVVPRRVPPATVEAVSRHIVLGGSFRTLSRLPGGPSEGTLRRWMRDPAFAEAVAEACEIREGTLTDQLLDAIQTVEPANLQAMGRVIGGLRRRLAVLRRWPTKAAPMTPRARPKPPLA